MESARTFVLRNFELLVVAVFAAGTAFAVLVAVNKVAFLNFFYIPVLLAAYFLGRKQGLLAALAAVLMVVVYAMLNPGIFRPSQTEVPELSLFLWGAFTLVTAYVVGTLYEIKTSALGDLRQAYEGVLEILAKFIDAVDRYTNDHSARVAAMSLEMAHEMGLRKEEVENVRVAALLHDVGKVELSLDVLRKASELDGDEWNQIKTHTAKGTAMLRPFGGLLADVLPLVECHHERFDGSGYNGLGGDAIPLGARIIALADAYDSMVSDRPYRMGRSGIEAMAEVERCRGSQFDPAVVDAFKRVMNSRREYA